MLINYFLFPLLVPFNNLLSFLLLITLDQDRILRNAMQNGRNDNTTYWTVRAWLENLLKDTWDLCLVTRILFMSNGTDASQQDHIFLAFTIQMHNDLLPLYNLIFHFLWWLPLVSVPVGMLYLIILSTFETLAAVI